MSDDHGVLVDLARYRADDDDRNLPHTIPQYRDSLRNLIETLTPRADRQLSDADRALLSSARTALEVALRLTRHLPSSPCLPEPSGPDFP